MKLPFQSLYSFYILISTKSMRRENGLTPQEREELRALLDEMEV